MAPSLIRDRVCTPCMAGSSFKPLPGQSTGCEPVQDCQAGFFESQAPTVSTDRLCVPCPAGTFKDVPGQSACRPVSECPLGSELVQAASTTADVICASCPAGSSDVDENPSTPCEPCLAGTFAASGTYGRCPPCPAGEVDNDSNPATECATCVGNSFQSSPGQTSCIAVGLCPVDAHETVPPTPSTDHVCSRCQGNQTYIPLQATKRECVTVCARGVRFRDWRSRLLSKHSARSHACCSSFSPSLQQLMLAESTAATDRLCVSVVKMTIDADYNAVVTDTDAETVGFFS